MGYVIIKRASPHGPHMLLLGMAANIGFSGLNLRSDDGQDTMG